MLSKPKLTSLDLRGTICGVPLWIRPFFWVSVLALGIRYLADPEAGSLGYFAFWIAVAFGSILVHALSQVAVGRHFGMRGEVILYELGSIVLGLESLKRWWQRALVLLAGPLAQFAIVYAIWCIAEFAPFPHFLSDREWQTPFATAAAILVRINLTCGILNLLPMWPLVGGRIALDGAESLLGRKGRTLAMVLSLMAVALLGIKVVLALNEHLNNRFDPRYFIYLQEGIAHLVICYVMWMRNISAMWPTETAYGELQTETSLRLIRPSATIASPETACGPLKNRPQLW